MCLQKGDEKMSSGSKSEKTRNGKKSVGSYTVSEFHSKTREIKKFKIENEKCRPLRAWQD